MMVHCAGELKLVHCDGELTVVECGGKLKLYDFCSWLKLECLGATLKVADRGVATLQLANCGDEPELQDAGCEVKPTDCRGKKEQDD